MTGQAAFQPNAAPAPRLTFKGAVSVTNFVTTDQVMFKEFARWDELEVSGIDLAFEPNRLKVDQVKLVGLHGNLILGADRRPNLSLILVGPEPPATNAAPAAAPATSPAAKPAAEPFPLELGTLALDRASFGFTDESIQPHASMDVEELSGTVKGISSALDTTAEVRLAGKMNAQSPFAISGRANPLASKMFVDLVFTNANTQLTPLTSYMEKYAGHPLTKGRLNTVLSYHLEGKELTAANQVRIDQLTLGSRNNSPDATKLPVKLGVALLKDSHGSIELDVPIKGRLDDPQFSVGPIVLKVIMNLLTKAATSPFKLLGALVGGGDELSFVEFSPGTTNVPTAELEKLGKLAKALVNRPALNVEIEGAIDPAADREVLSLQKLRDQLKAQRLHELAAKGKAPESVEGFTVDPENYDRLLRAAFAAQFGTNISAIMRTNQVAAATTKKPVKHGLIRTTIQAGAELFDRGIAIFGLGSYARTSTAEKHLTKVDRIALEQATPALMERLLADTVPVTNDDYRRLMEARARWVQDWLLQNGGVTADRMLLVAPKPVDTAYQGEARANLTLN